MDRLIYCYKLNRDTFAVERFVVDDYTFTDRPIGGGFYSFYIGTACYHVDEQDFDKFLNGKYVSFEDDAKKVNKVILSIYENKLKQLEADKMRVEHIVSILKGENNEENGDILPV